jgi:hypothetical protein
MRWIVIWILSLVTLSDALAQTDSSKTKYFINVGLNKASDARFGVTGGLNAGYRNMYVKLDYLYNTGDFLSLKVPQLNVISQLSRACISGGYAWNYRSFRVLPMVGISYGKETFRTNEVTVDTAGGWLSLGWDDVTFHYTEKYFVGVQTELNILYQYKFLGAGITPYYHYYGREDYGILVNLYLGILGR